MKQNILKIVFIGLMAVLLLSSCATTKIASFYTKENGGIELYSTKVPQRDYIEICYIQTDGSIFHTPHSLLNGLTKKAIELKADAIINIKYDFQAWYPIASGIAIKYTEK